jgi:hypothetical protein
MNKPDYRDFLVLHASCALATQKEHLDGEVYENWDDLLRSLRPKSIVRVYRPYLLGGAAGTTRKRRRVWAERADQVREKGNKLVSIDPPLSGNKLAMMAAEQIGNISRGPRAGQSGRPKKDFTSEQWAVIRHHWPPRRGVKGDEAIGRINSDPKMKRRRVTKGWCYANVKA